MGTLYLCAAVITCMAWKEEYSLLKAGAEVSAQQWKDFLKIKFIFWVLASLFVAPVWVLTYHMGFAEVILRETVLSTVIYFGPRMLYRSVRYVRPSQ